MPRWIVWGCLLLVVWAPARQAGAVIIDPARRITWTAGVRGGIPTTRTTLLNVRNAPYNAVGDGVADDTTPITSAIAAAAINDIVYLPAGHYRVTARLDINKSITIRGDGPGVTFIEWSPTIGTDVFRTTAGGSIGTATAITSGNTKGSTSITVASATGMTVGAKILITQTNDSSFVFPSGNGGACTWCGKDIPTQAMTQMNAISAVAGTTLTLETPLYLDFTGTSPVAKSVSMGFQIGFEDFTVTRTAGTITSIPFNGGNIHLLWCSNCWVKNVRSIWGTLGHVTLENSYANTVRDSWFEFARDRNGGGYGIWVYQWNSEHLIENNILNTLRHSISLEGGGSGNVFGYNFSVNELAQSAPGVDETGFLTEIWHTHGAHPFMNLFESNIGGKAGHDNTWGSASHNTWFRNWTRNFSAADVGSYGGRHAMEIDEHSYFNNVVGCVLGRPGDTGVQFLSSGGGQSSYRLGFASAGGTSVTDSLVSPRTYIHGSYDYIGNQTLFDSGNADHTLPASLYLATKPSFFGGLAWPMLGSDLTPKTADIPAKIHFEGGTVPPETGGPTILRILR